MIKHILLIIRNQWKANIWLMTELFLVSLCMWYVLDYIGVVVYNINKPVGFETSDTWKVEMALKFPESDGYIFPEETSLGEDVLTVIERVRQYPMVQHVSVSLQSQPYYSAFHGHYERFYINDTASVWGQHYRVSPDFFDIFRIASPTGSVQEMKNSLLPHTVILSQKAIEEFQNTGVSAPEYIRIGEEGHPLQLAGISESIRRTEYDRPLPSAFTLLTDQLILEQVNENNYNHLEICIRTKPEVGPLFVEAFMEDMTRNLMVGNLFLMGVLPTEIYHEQVIAGDKAELMILRWLFNFLLCNIFLGVAGAFWLRTNTRRREMGLRVAIGSTRPGLYTLLLLEGLIMLFICVPVVMLISFNIGFLELVSVRWMEFTFQRFLFGMLGTWVIMSLIILAGIWYPAWRTIQMKPAEALHYE